MSSTGLDSAAEAALFAPVANENRIGLAVSGGADSLALLLMAADWARARSIQLVVYTVDHGLRDAARDEVAMVAAIAQERDLAARVLRWEGPKPETGVQAAARAARYGLIRDAMAADGIATVMTAHHLGDQAETVLMRLAHGSGIEGLRGMDALAMVEGCRIFRPLLGVDPEWLAARVAAAGLVPVRDPSNADTHYERVRWRQMRPALAALGLDARRLGQFAQRMADADAALGATADSAFTTLVHIGPEGDAELLRAGLAGLPRLIGIRVLALALARVGGGETAGQLIAIESLRDRLVAGPMPAATLGHCVVAGDGLRIAITRENGRRAHTDVTRS